MKIKVYRCEDYWREGTSRKIVPDDVVELSEELYLCEEKIRNRKIPEGTETRICRLISGVHGSSELGFHFAKEDSNGDEWVTVCPVDVEYAVFWGTRKSTLIRVDDSNDSLLQILRET